MRMRVLIEKLRVEIENETRFFLESLNFEIEMRVSQKSEENISICISIDYFANMNKLVVRVIRDHT